MFSAAAFVDIKAVFDTVLPQSIINSLEDLALGCGIFLLDTELSERRESIYFNGRREYITA